MMIGLGLSLCSSRGTSFDPLSVADCLLWLRADLGVTESGGAVSAWADQSGAADANRNALQGTATNQPAFVAADANFGNAPTISFDGNDNYLATGAFTGGPYAQPVTMYAAFRHAASGGYVFDDIDGSSRLAFVAGTASGGFFFAGSAAVSFDTATGTTYVVGLVFDGAGSASYVNNSQTAAVTDDVGANALKSLQIGSRNNEANFLTGQIAEILAYSGAHDAATRRRVMQYMGARVGVSVT
jgi:hypothetical protein